MRACMMYPCHNIIGNPNDIDGMPIGMAMARIIEQCINCKCIIINYITIGNNTYQLPSYSSYSAVVMAMCNMMVIDGEE